MKAYIGLMVFLLGTIAGTAVAGHQDNLVNGGRQPLGLLWSRLLSSRNTVASQSLPQCPPQNFDSVKNFDLLRYIEAPWYVQKQIPIVFQPVDTLYCVRAKYTLLDPSKPFGGVLVQNYANRGQVNGPSTGTSGSGTSGFPGRFLANVPNPQDPSKLNVGFALGNANVPLVGAPYWVVAIDPDYQWAIITGGAPDKTTQNGKCITDGGFWLFSRQPVDPQNTAKMIQIAEGLGLDTSALLPVPQEGCLYQGA